MGSLPAARIGYLLVEASWLTTDAGRIHACPIVTVDVSETTLTIELDGQDTRTIRRTTT